MPTEDIQSAQAEFLHRGGLYRRLYRAADSLSPEYLKSGLRSAAFRSDLIAHNFWIGIERLYQLCAT